MYSLILFFAHYLSSIILVLIFTHLNLLGYFQIEDFSLFIALSECRPLPDKFGLSTPCLCSDIKDYFTIANLKKTTLLPSFRNTSSKERIAPQLPDAVSQKYFMYEETVLACKAFSWNSGHRQVSRQHMRYWGQEERGTEEMQAQVKYAAEKKVWLRRSRRTLQSYCLLSRDTWQQLRLESTLEHIRQENKRDLSLHVISSHISQWGQEQGGGDTPHKGRRQHQGTVEPKLGTAITNLFFSFYCSCKQALKSWYHNKDT